MEVKPGMRFSNGGVLIEVKRPNARIPGDWWCEPVEHNIGLWSYSGRTILEGLVSTQRVSQWLDNV